LNVGSTLVLIDGHRSAPYPIVMTVSARFVDIGIFPSTQSSAWRSEGRRISVYGSDAIAGVVNII